MTRFGAFEIGLILLVVLLIFGPTKLPGLAKAIGKSVVELKEGLKGKPSEEANPEAGRQKTDA